jgi:hypothetical protein
MLQVCQTAYARVVYWYVRGTVFLQCLIDKPFVGMTVR